MNQHFVKEKHLHCIRDPSRGMILLHFLYMNKINHCIRLVWNWMAIVLFGPVALQFLSCRSIINVLQGLLRETRQHYLEAISQCRPLVKCLLFVALPASSSQEQMMVYLNWMLGNALNKLLLTKSFDLVTVCHCMLPPSFQFVMFGFYTILIYIVIILKAPKMWAFISAGWGILCGQVKLPNTSKYCNKFCLSAIW